MKSSLRALIILITLLPIQVLAQINDCQDAEVICDSHPFEFNPIGPGFNDYADPDNIPGCIVSLEQNSAWYYFEIDPNAPPDLELGFIIHPLGGFGEDYDWALYGPDVNCGALGSPIRCSSSSFECDFCPETGMGMGATDFTEGPGTGDGFVATLTVQPGQGFYLMIDNWLGTTNGFNMEWTGSAAEHLNCDAEPPCALNAHAGADIHACEGEENVLLDGGSDNNDGTVTYVWTGTNGGTGFLDNPNSEDPTVTIPLGFIGTITYTIVATEDTCVSEDQMDLVVHALPNITLNPVGPFCPNSGPVGLVATPLGGSWSGDNTGNTFNPMLQGPGLHTVTYTYTDAFGCSAMESMDILVHDGPEVSIDPNPAEFCTSDGSVLLTAMTEGGTSDYTYNWTTPNGPATGETYEAVTAGAHIVTVTDANGCTHSSTIQVVENLNPDIEINDPGPICGSTQFITITAIPNGGLFDGAIISGTGDILPSEEDPGTYEISYTYTDNNNCSSTAYLDITIIPVPQAIAGNNGPVCSSQQIQLTGSTDGTGSVITYQWTGPNGYSSNQQNPTDAEAGGVYSLVVIVDDCPSATGTTTVVVVDAPEATATNGGPYCNGEPILLTGSVNGSGNVITWSWTGPGGFTSDVQNPGNATMPGTYTLIVSIDGCPSEPVTTDVVFSTAPDATATNSGPYCQGEAIALFGNTMSSGSMITYQWTGPGGYGSSMQNPTDASLPGSYQLIIAVDGCQSAAAATTVTVHPAPQPMITGQSEFCTGFSSTMDAGGGYSSYFWDNGNATQTREVSVAGTYYVTVTDANGCTGTDSFTVTENAALSPVIMGSLEFCEGAGTILDAGTGYATYAWSTGQTTQTIPVMSGGNVGVIVTDADGCTGSAIVTTIEHPNPNVVIGGSTTYCIGGFTVLDAGNYTAYQWNTSAITQTITVSTPGIFSVSVTDVNGCTGSASVDVEESTSLNPVITGSPAFCENGSTTLNAGSGFATYLWSDGSMNQTLIVSVAGTYSVSVSDGQGCTGDAEVIVTEVLPPSTELQPGITLCNTEAGGSVLDLFDLIISGDATGTWADLDNSGAVGLFNNLNFESIPAGDYRFEYTTNSAIAPCPESTYQVIVTVIDCSCPEISFINAGALCNESDILNLSTIVSTTEPGTWSITQEPPGSNPAVLNGTMFNATGADAGTYLLQFTLQNQPPPGCPLDFQVEVQVDPSVDAGTALQPVEFCFGENEVVNLRSLLQGADPNGVWTETSSAPSQGSAFNAANATFTIDQQVAGTYLFQYAIASNGACPDDAATVSVIINAAPTLVAPDDVTLDCSNPVLSLDATGSSSGAQYAITWTGPGIVIDGNENTLRPTVNQAGQYVLTITNLNTGCSSTASATVTANTDPPTDALLSVLQPGCFGEENGFIQVEDVIGGSGPYAYSINNGLFGLSGGFNQLAAGTYQIVVQDDNGCLWDTTITLIEAEEVLIDIGPDIEIDLGDTATAVQATINLPTDQIDMIQWDPASLIECLDPLCTQVIVNTFHSLTITATVTATSGCENSDQLTITVDADRGLYIPNVFSPNGDRINDIFYIQGDAGQILNINRFIIYNRWGGVVHEALDFLPNDESRGWDGLDGEDAISPGVFTYMAEVEFIDKIVLVYKGDVTLVR